MQRVRDQREAARQDAADDLRDGEQPVRPDGDGHPAIARLRVEVGMAVIMRHGNVS